MTLYDLLDVNTLLGFVTDSPALLLVWARPLGLVLGLAVVFWLLGLVVDLFASKRKGGES